jgi:hypothetical protein
MTTTDIHKIVILNALVAFLVMIAAALSIDWPYGLGIFAGAMWGSVNLLCIKQVMNQLLLGGDTKFLPLILLLGIKFPLLYLSGYALLKVGFFPHMALVWGFSLMMAILFIYSALRLCIPARAA